MKTPRMNTVAVAATMATLSIFAFQPASTQAQVSGPDNRLGCVVKIDGMFHFLEQTARDQPPPTLPDGARKVFGSCVAGSPNGMLAMDFAAKASSRPDKFAPLSPAQVRPAKAQYTGNGRSPTYQYERYANGGYTFSLVGIDDKGLGYGAAFDANFVSYVAVLENGQISITHSNAEPWVVNRHGTQGGIVWMDPVNFVFQAAIFRGNAVELIPPQAGEGMSYVAAINDKGEALVVSVDSVTSVGTLFLYDHGKKTQINLPVDVNAVNFLGLNNARTMIYTYENIGHKVDLLTMKDTVLEPLPGNKSSWAVSINDRGDVLGYSYDPGENVGVWHPNSEFELYFAEGNQQYPTVSFNLAFNERDEIVISNVRAPLAEQGNAYLLTKPGVRINLADVTVGQPPDAGTFFFISGINKRGDIAGTTDTAEAYILRGKKGDR
ncbi:MULTISPECIES: hypothetical protein [Cupriavidus]|uniref:hypothetical protein n=1 Tax=Cupriavidus sp. DF5525 TaxID=3160989 RepID=UPI0032DFB759